MEVTMRRTVATVGVTAAIILAGSAEGWAGDRALEVLKASSISGLVFEQRRDVEEVSLPPPPSGPATPVPFCTPAQPICP
jgi:hypothetical protein